MEQQDSVQGIKEEGSYAQETTELSLNDVSVPYEFRDGMYYAEGVEGGYMSLTTLRRAWAMAVKAKKLKEARGQASGVGKASKNSEASKEKARKEYRKWQATEVE